MYKFLYSDLLYNSYSIKFLLYEKYKRLYVLQTSMLKFYTEIKDKCCIIQNLLVFNGTMI